MKFIANVLVKIEVEADTEEFAKELLSEQLVNLNIGSLGYHADHEDYSLQTIGRRVMSIQNDNVRFVLKAKDSGLYLKSSEHGINSYTDNISLAFVWKCNTSISELKIDEDMYEIFVI